jgi:uncharacterized membrane protein HdeD (DUF308 family)
MFARGSVLLRLVRGSSADRRAGRGRRSAAVASQATCLARCSARRAGPWWLLLLTGIAWLILSWVALRFTPASVATVGVLLGVLFLFGMLDEILIAAVRPGWRWLHVVTAVIFAFGAGWSFARPYNAFWTLASILGLLVIFRGTLDIITSVDARPVNGVWWLGLVAGILEILLGFWASGQYLAVRGALLLV